MRATPAVPLVIGVGNEHRHDDRCGLDVVRSLHERVGDRALCIEAPGDATELLDLWESAAEAWVIDAARSGAPVGTVQEFRLAGNAPWPSGATSSHGLTVGDAVGIGRALHRLPERLTVFSIEVEDLSVGDGLTPPVAAAARSLVDRLARALGAPPGEEPPHA